MNLSDMMIEKRWNELKCALKDVGKKEIKYAENKKVKKPGTSNEIIEKINEKKEIEKSE